MKRIFPFINLLILALTFYVGVDTYRKVSASRAGPRTKMPVSRPEKVLEKSEAIKPFNDYSTITYRNLFKTEDETAPKTQPEIKPVETLKQTELNVKLWGTVIGPDSATYAVIEERQGREQNLYKEGDTVQSAMIKLILREKVVLTVNGNDEVLEIEKMEGTGKGRMVSRAALPAGQQPVSLPPQNIILKRADLMASLQDTDKMMKEVRIRPHFTDGKPDGVMLTGIRPNSVFRKMGLRNGDIILGVDENDIRSVDDALNIYQNMRQSAAVTMKIKRRGRLRTFNYTIE